MRSQRWCGLSQQAEGTALACGWAGMSPGGTSPVPFYIMIVPRHLWGQRLSEEPVWRGGFPSPEGTGLKGFNLGPEQTWRGQCPATGGGDCEPGQSQKSPSRGQQLQARLMHTGPGEHRPHPSRVLYDNPMGAGSTPVSQRRKLRQSFRKSPQPSGSHASITPLN